MSSNSASSLSSVFWFLLLTVLTPAATLAQTTTPTATGTVRGVVLDRAGGAPIGDVSVRLQDSKQAATTDAAGRFELSGVTPGARELYVSIVGFILVKKTVQVVAGQPVDVTIVLTEGTGTYSENVTVSGERFPEQEKGVVAQQVLGSAEILNLRSLVTNDPMRAIQVLPGVTTGDDFRSEFAVRGSSFNRIVFTFDGIPSTFLLHTVQQVTDGGSIAMLNGDILDGITLMNGSYPQRYGNRTGAELDFHMREGSRDRRQARIGVSGTDASFVAEGPLGRQKSGSWLVSVRQSYLQYLLKQISPDDDFGFGFADTQAKFVKDLSPRHQIAVSFVAGRSRFDAAPESDDPGELTDGRNSAQLVNVEWRYTPTAATVVTQRVGVAANQFSNKNVDGLLLGDGDGHDLTWRGDVTWARSSQFTLETGAGVQRQQRRNQIVDGAELFSLSDGTAVHASGYAQVVWTPFTRLSIVPGARVDHWSLTGGTSGSPWIQASWKLTKSFSVRGGGGIYQQFPDIEAVTLSRFNQDHATLTQERAYHADIGVEQVLGQTRWQLTLYDRQDHDVIRGYGFEPTGGQVSVFGWRNALDGYARGVELLVQRRSTSGLTGWLAYSYGLNRYHDRLTGETFDGDFDQRHTFNAYVVARVTNRTSLALKLRAGSNFPMTGYWRVQDARYFIGPDRNRIRVPAYSRLDFRFSRTFNLSGKRLTLFVEVLNLLGHENVRFTNPGFFSARGFPAEVLFQSMIPRVPSAGLLWEF